jgi:sarcosine oxidase
MAQVYQAVVVGGGINGLATLAHLLARGCTRLALLERFEPGHDRGSSHGAARITRSVYSAADYVRLMQRVHAESWPALEARVGRRLIHPNPGCFFGPEDGLFGDYADAVSEVIGEGATGAGAMGGGVERLTAARAAERFPQFNFAPGEGVLDDRTAGVVAAADTLEALTGLCREGGVDLRYGVRVLEIGVGEDPLALETSAGRVLAERVVVTAGAWAGALLPRLAPRLEVTRQAVCYLRLARPAEGLAGRFPVWVELGRSEAEVWYGLPEFRAAGIKAAHHRVVGGDDPEADLPPDEAAVAALEARLRGRLALEIDALAATERCLYTVAPGEDFVLDLHPDDPRIAVGAGFSGHGFKFGPMTGQILAELALDGRTSIPEFEHARARFAMSWRPEVW